MDFQEEGPMRADTDRRGEPDDGVYAVIAEFKTEAPIILETGLEATSFEAAQARMHEMAARREVLRVQMVRLVPVHIYGGNSALLRAIVDLRK